MKSVDDFLCEPHQAVSDLSGGSPAGAAWGTAKQLTLLNMVAAEAGEDRQSSAALVRENPDWAFQQMRLYASGPTLFAPRHDRVLDSDVNAGRLRRIIVSAHERQPRDFAALLGTEGVGPASIRSLARLAELIYEAPVSHRDPALRAPAPENATPSEARRWADYVFAHGGKDGTPFPVDLGTYGRNIHILREAVRRARIGENDKAQALKRLAGDSQA